MKNRILNFPDLNRVPKASVSWSRDRSRIVFSYEFPADFDPSYDWLVSFVLERVESGVLSTIEETASELYESILRGGR